MDTFKLNLEESATRKSIFGKLVAAIKNDDKRASVGRIVADTSIPAQATFSNLNEVIDTINHSIATDWVKQQAISIYKILAQAEAKVHGCKVEETHFHEVGLGMTIREILGMCSAVELLGKPNLVITDVQVGSGTVECSHGILDTPAPATASILKDYGIHIAKDRLQGELCTPTSAAFIAYFTKQK